MFRNGDFMVSTKLRFRRLYKIFLTQCDGLSDTGDPYNKMMSGLKWKIGRVLVYLDVDIYQEFLDPSKFCFF